jgi:hypothetical protein
VIYNAQRARISTFDKLARSNIYSRWIGDIKNDLT